MLLFNNCLYYTKAVGNKAPFLYFQAQKKRLKFNRKKVL